MSPEGRLAPPAPPSEARHSAAWTISALAHAMLVAAALVLIRSAVPVVPSEPATVEMAFVATPAPAEAASEASRQPVATASDSAPATEAPPPVQQQQVQAPAPPVEPPLAWQPVRPPERPTLPKPKPVVVHPPGPAPARPEASAEAATPGPAAPSPASAPHAEEVHAAPIDGGWMQAVGAWLAAHKKYPDEARQRGEEGRLAVRFTMDRSGQVTAVQVVRGSGSEALDQAAVTMLRDAKLPPLPEAMPQPTITVTVQIRFALGP